MGTVITPERLTREGHPAAPKRTCITYEEWRKMSIANQRQEIVDGELVMIPAPSVERQWLSGDLFELLRRHVRNNRLGVVLTASLDIVIRDSPKLRTRQPDIAYFSTARSGFSKRSDVRGMGALKVPPTWR